MAKKLSKKTKRKIIVEIDGDAEFGDYRFFINNRVRFTARKESLAYRDFDLFDEKKKEFLIQHIQEQVSTLSGLKDAIFSELVCREIDDVKFTRRKKK